MKTLALLSILCSGLMSASLQAQELTNNILTMPISAPCFLKKDAEKFLSQEHKELEFAQGESIVWNSKLDEYIPVKTRIFVNPDTFTFTVVFDIDEDDVTCMFTTGENFRPVRPTL